jgi:hypothetical protein
LRRQAQIVLTTVAAAYNSSPSRPSRTPKCTASALSSTALRIDDNAAHAACVANHSLADIRRRDALGDFSKNSVLISDPCRDGSRGRHHPSRTEHRRLPGRFPAGSDRPDCPGRSPRRSCCGERDAAARGEPRAVSVIVRLFGESLASYQGTIPGLDATNPRATGRKRLNPRSTSSERYLRHLESRRANFKSELRPRFRQHGCNTGIRRS